SAGILASAQSTLVSQRRGLVLLHWPDADRAGHEHGWMSEPYGDACLRLDASLARLRALTADDNTVLIALAGPGGGGAAACDHESDHPLDRTIPLVLFGDGIAPRELGPATLLDVPPTILHLLGIPAPESHEGRVLMEAFEDAHELAPAVA